MYCEDCGKHTTLVETGKFDRHTGLPKFKEICLNKTCKAACEFYGHDLSDDNFYVCYRCNKELDLDY